MAKDPAVLFYTSDFLSGTFTMDYEQKGKYITLLCLQHQKGFLTQKDLKLVLSDTDIEVFEKFVLADDGFYYNIKMKECADKRKAYSESRRNNRKSKSVDDINNLSKRYDEHMINTSSTYDKHMETGTGIGNETVNVNTIENINEIGSEEVELEEYYQEAYMQELEKEYNKLEKLNSIEDINAIEDKDTNNIMKQFNNTFADLK